jgi:hypothetical protein
MGFEFMDQEIEQDVIYTMLSYNSDGEGLVVEVFGRKNAKKQGYNY